MACTPAEDVCGASSNSDARKRSMVDNPHLNDMDVDVLYHLGLDTSMDLPAMFGDVKFVVLGGSNTRMQKVATLAAKRLGINDKDPTDLCSTDRYSMYKVGPIMSCSHGIGMPSISVLLHELAKLMYYAKADDPAFIRIGTSGGLGAEPGTVVITSESLNGSLKASYDVDVLGKPQTLATKFDNSLCMDLLAMAERLSDPKVGLVQRGIIGKTMSSICFYNGQGRVDGAYCDYTLEDKMEFLKSAYDKGVRNIEMESLYLSAFTGRLKIRAACICATLLDRLKGDQVTASKDEMAKWVASPVNIVLEYIAQQIHHNKESNGTTVDDTAATEATETAKGDASASSNKRPRDETETAQAKGDGESTEKMQKVEA